MRVLILGANSDVAESLSAILAKEGHELILAGRSKEKLDALASDLKIRYENSVLTILFDAEKVEAHKQFYETLPQKPDWVICAFGLLVDQNEAETNAKLTMQSYWVNMLGAISILDIIANDFINRKSGFIIGISSVAGDRGRGSNYTYGSAKAGFSAYLSGLRNRLDKYGVHVITVKPGFINSKMTAHLVLPKILTASPNQVAYAIRKSIDKKRNVVYVKWVWKYIMMIIKFIPESIFKKMSL